MPKYILQQLSFSSKQPVDFLYADEKLLVLSLQSVTENIPRESIVLDVFSTNGNRVEILISDTIGDNAHSYYAAHSTSLYWSDTYKQLDIVIKSLEGNYSCINVAFNGDKPKVKTQDFTVQQQSFASLDERGITLLSFTYPGNFSRLHVKREGGLEQNSEVHSSQNGAYETMDITQLTNKNIAVALRTEEADFSMSEILLYDNSFNFLKKKKFTGTIDFFETMKNNQLFALHFFDEKGEDAEAVVLDNQLTPLSSYKSPNFYEIVNPQGDFKVLDDGSILLSKLIRTNEEDGEIVVKKYGPDGIKTIPITQGKGKGLIDIELVRIEDKWFVIGVSLDNIKHPKGTVIDFYPVTI